MNFRNLFFAITGCLMSATETLAADGVKVNLPGQSKPEVHIIDPLKPVTITNNGSVAESLDALHRIFPHAPNGDRISRSNWTRHESYAFASSDGKPEILKKLANGGIAFVIRDEKGLPKVTLTPGSFRVAGISNGKLRKHLLETASNNTLSFAFSVLIDNSGSMLPVMPRLREEAKRFVSSMGNRHLCRIAKFDNRRVMMTNGFEPCGNHGSLNAIQALDGSGPNTNLASAIIEDMKSMTDAKADFKALLVLSDGKETGAGTAGQILQHKTEPVFAWWIGPEKTDTVLKPVSDHFFSDLGGGTAVLEKMLRTVAASYQGIQVIHVRQN